MTHPNEMLVKENGHREYVNPDPIGRRDYMKALALAGGTVLAGSALTAEEAMAAVADGSPKIEFGDAASDPAANGVMARNGTDVKVFTGGALKNMSNIGGGSGYSIEDVVRDHDATADGSTDDSTAIQDAVDAATTDGGVVYFPPTSDSYLIESSITPKDNVWFVGHAWPTITGNSLGTSAMFEQTTGLLNCRWLGLEIDGTGAWSGTAYDAGQKCIFVDKGSNDAKDLVVANCHIHDSDATAIGIDHAIRDYYLYNRIENAGTDGQTTGSNGIGIGVSNTGGRAPTYVIGNEILDTAEFAIIMEQTGGGSSVAHGGMIAGNVVEDFRIGIGVEHVDGLSIQGNTYRSSTRADKGLLLDTLDGSTGPARVTVTGEQFLGNDWDDANPIHVTSNATEIVISDWVIEGSDSPSFSSGNVVFNGVGKFGGGTAGTPTASNWEWAAPVHVRNTGDETLWRIQFGTVEQLSYGEPQDVSSASGGFNGHTVIHDGTGTPPLGLAMWDTSLATGSGNWRSQVDGTTFGPN